MKTNKVLCEECRGDVEYTVLTVSMTGTLKGKEYHYTGSEARCNNCGALVYVPELNDSNLEALYDKYHKAQQS